MSMTSPDASGGGGTGLRAKLGPLEYWQWGAVIILGIVGFAYWRNRNSSASSDSSAVDNADGGYTTADVNSGDYSSGYDYGYMAGLNANGNGSSSSSGGGTTDTGGNAKGPIAHNKFSAKTKDPAGKSVTAVGYGTWIRSGNGWKWQPGIPKQYALPGNGTQANSAVAASAAMPALTSAADDVQAAGGDTLASGSSPTLSQATGTSAAGTTLGAGSSAPKQTATNAQKIAQIIKDLQNPGPKYTAATQASQLQEYQTLTGHAYTGKLGQLQVGQPVGYATV